MNGQWKPESGYIPGEKPTSLPCTGVGCMPVEIIRNDVAWLKKLGMAQMTFLGAFALFLYSLLA